MMLHHTITRLPSLWQSESCDDRSKHILVTYLWQSESQDNKAMRHSVCSRDRGDEEIKFVNPHPLIILQSVIHQSARWHQSCYCFAIASLQRRCVRELHSHCHTVWSEFSILDIGNPEPLPCLWEIVVFARCPSCELTHSNSLHLNIIILSADCDAADSTKNSLEISYSRPSRCQKERAWSYDTTEKCQKKASLTNKSEWF